MSRLSRRLPPPQDFGWTLRPVSSADVVQTQLGDGRLEVLINHAPLKGITTEMLEWWFQSFDGMAHYRGRSIPAYHLWHPLDHVGVKFDRGGMNRVAPGCTISIQEVFARDPQFEVNVTAVIHRWDRRGVGFHSDVLGHRISELDHVFTDTPAGVDYRSRLRFGAGHGPLRGLINGLVVARRLSPALATAWIRHNIEEVGCFEAFLPELHAARAIVVPGAGGAWSSKTATATS